MRQGKDQFRKVSITERDRGDKMANLTRNSTRCRYELLDCSIRDPR